MPDLGDALTGSLPRDGSAPMVGPLTLANSTPTSSRHAASKGYVDQFAAYASGLPIGAVLSYAGAITPGGFLLCNGQLVNPATYPALFALIGTSFGGDGLSTFGVPNLQNQFVRGRGGSRTIGSTQAGSIESHVHPVTDPGHLHAVTDPMHSHPVTTVAHGHVVTDPGHFHETNDQTAIYADGTNTSRNFRIAGSSNSGAKVTGISLQTAAPTGTATAAATGINVASAATGIAVGAAGAAETVPQNMAFDFYIKAIQDSAGPTAVTSIDSSDDNIISVDSTNPAVPLLQIHANVAFGTVKLDSQSKIPVQLLPTGNQQLLGTWDASTGNNPSDPNGGFPTTTYNNGDTFIVGVDGTIDVYDPATMTSAPTPVSVGNELLYIDGSLVNPTGWYYIIATIVSVTAGQVAFTPVGNITANNVQAMGAELDAEKVALDGTGATGTWNINISGNAATATNATNATTAASCSGNAVTATTAASCSGNAASATTAAACSGNSATATLAKQVPTSTNASNTIVVGDAGKCLDVTVSQTVPSNIMAIGDIVSVYNGSAGTISLVQASGLTLRINGAVAGATRSLPAYTMATIWFKSPTIAIVTGSGVT